MTNPAPARLVAFSISVTAICPATQQVIALATPNPTWDIEGMEAHKAKVAAGEAKDTDAPWNKPRLGLRGWEYDDEDAHASESGMTLTVTNCPACGGNHPIELENFA